MSWNGACMHHVALADPARAQRTAAQRAQQTPGAPCSSTGVLTPYKQGWHLLNRSSNNLLFESASAVTL
jgi:hypothetical protein